MSDSTHVRLCIATPLSVPDIGGPATYTAFLQKHLPRHRIPFEVVSFRDVRRYPKFIRHLLFMYNLLLKARACSVIYALDTVSVGVPARIVSLVLRKPFMVRVPGDYAWEQGQERFGLTSTLDEYLAATDLPWQVRLLAWCESRVARSATRVIVPSEYLKKVVMTWGVPESKIIRIYSALKVIEVLEEREALRRKFGYEGLVIATAGRLVPWKGVRTVIDALVELRKNGTPATLVIFGDGPLRAELEAHTRAIQTAPFVRFMGNVDRAVLGEHLKAADVFVLNTAYEGLSHQLLEAMHLGVPIVTTAVGGNVELVHDGENGLLIPVNDVQVLAQTCAKLYNDAALRDALALRAREKVRIFDETVLASEIVTVIEQVGRGRP